MFHFLDKYHDNGIELDFTLNTQLYKLQKYNSLNLIYMLKKETKVNFQILYKLKVKDI